MEILENDSLIVKAKSQGAELCSIIRKSDGRTLPSKPSSSLHASI